MLTNDPGKAATGYDTQSFAKALRECLACGIVTVDERDTVLTFNTEAEKLTGIKAAQVLNQSAARLPAELLQVLHETLGGGVPIHERLIRLPAANRASIPVHVHTGLVHSANGRAALAVLNDLTFTRQLEQHLRRLDRLANVGTLSASIAHEIKNAMVAVKTFLDLLLEKNRDAELAAIVRREVCRIDSLVVQMLKFAAPAPSDHGPVRLHEILDHSLRLVQHQLESKAIVLNRTFAAAPDVVNGNHYHLEQAFLNLFLNAVEAMGTEGRLSVCTEIVEQTGQTPALMHNQRHPHVRIMIQDNGVGIPKENINRLFDPFFTTKPNGTGLGLPITRRIIQEHNGVIEITAAPDQGTTFTILIPLLAEPH